MKAIYYGVLIFMMIGLLITNPAHGLGVIGGLVVIGLLAYAVDRKPSD